MNEDQRNAGSTTSAGDSGPIDWTDWLAQMRARSASAPPR